MVSPIRLTVMPDAGDVVPGGSLTFALTVRNASAILDRYQILLSGVPDDWYTLDESSVSLPPGESGQVSLVILAPSGAAPGEYPITVQAISDEDPQTRSSLRIGLTVTAVADLGMDVAPVTAQGKEATFRVTFASAGNAVVRVSLQARDDEAGLDFRLEPAGVLAVPPTGQASVRVQVQPHARETFGEPHNYAIEFRGVREGDQAATADPLLVRRARFTYEPRYTALALPLWLRRLPLWALVVLPLLLLALVFMAGNRVAAAMKTTPAATATVPVQHTATNTPLPTVDVGAPSATPIPPTAVVPAPVITDFGLSPGSGGTLQAHWNVRGPASVTLNGQAVPAKGTQAMRVTRDGDVVLLAENSAGSVSKILRVVPPPSTPVRVQLPSRSMSAPVIRRFTARPDASGALQLVWQVAGSDSVLVDGKPAGASGTAPLPPGQAGVHSLRAANVVGSVEASLTIQKPTSSVTSVVLLQPTINKFTITHAQPGTPYVITWVTSDATSVTLNSQPVQPSGSQSLPSPIQTGSFHLVARNGDGLTQTQLQVTVQ